MPVRRILQLGDPMLREVSSPVEDLSAARGILRDLPDTLHDFQSRHGFGRGISAVQIGEPKRAIFLEFEGAALYILNPQYEFQSEATFRLWDDCFSFPELLVFVERAESVVIRYTDELGNARRLAASGALSELLQHEIDHLDGILAVDRAIDRNSFCTREEFRRTHPLTLRISSTSAGTT